METAIPGQPGASGTRLAGFDRLRTLLTVLVIAHHTAITYGGSGGWFYREVTDAGAPFSLALTLFCSVNQAFFMGLFFLLAGYFSPPALAAKGWRRFVADRLLRLGLPLLVFGGVLGPLAVALAGVPAGQPAWPRWLDLMARGSFVIGPLWFAWALLLFTAGWLVWRLLRVGRTSPAALPGGSPRAPAPVPGDGRWLLWALVVGAAALALRQWVPVGASRWALQIGYFASYTFLFALGTMAWQHRWLETVPAAQARRWRRIAWWTVPLLPATAAATGALAGRAVDFSGGLGVAAVAYAFWEPFVAWGLIAWLLVRFCGPLAAARPLLQRWSGAAYGAFVLHAPVVTGLAVAIASWPLPVPLKFVLVLVAGTALSFGLADGLRRLPGVRRVL